jgi:transposase-like protein
MVPAAKKSLTVSMIREGASYQEAARYAGVTESTVIQWCKAAGVKSSAKPWHKHHKEFPMKTFSVIGVYLSDSNVQQIVCDSVQAKDGASAVKKTYKLEERKDQSDFRVIAAIPGEDLGITFND